MIAASTTAFAAEPDATTLHATYPVTGVTHIQATDSDLELGPGQLAADLDLKTGDFTANLDLPAATGHFKEIGVVPVTTTVEFIQANRTTGNVDPNTGDLVSTSYITLKLDSVKVAGIPVPVGPYCQSEHPARITVHSQPGFNVLNGGDLAGTYTIPRFTHCGLATPVINLAIAGGGNTITLTLGPADITLPGSTS